MVTTRAGWFALPLCASFGVACGNGGIALTDMPSQGSSTICGKVWSCCNAGDLGDKSPFGTDEPSCETSVKANLTAQQTSIQTDQSKGRVVYHGDRLAQCLSLWKSSTCTTLKSNATSVMPPCADYLEPLVPAGGLCGIDGDCVEGTCVGATPNQDGTCTLLAAEGASCVSAACGEGLFCDPGSKACVVVKEDGATCNLNGECATGGCNGRNPDAGTPGTCGLKGGATSTCFIAPGCTVGGPEVAAAGLLGILPALLARKRRVPRG